MQKRRHSIRRFSIGAWTVALVLLVTPAHAAFIAGSVRLAKGSLKFEGERAAPTGGDAKAAGAAVLYNDSTTHRLMLSSNNATYGNVLTDSSADGVAFLGVNSQSFTGSPQLFANGLSSAPSIAFTNSTGLGFFRSAADILGISTGGTQRAWLSSTGLGLGQAPTTRLTIGAGSTGTNAEVFTLDAGSGAGGVAAQVFARNSVTKAAVSVSGSTNGQVTGDVANDMVIRSTQKILLSADNATSHFELIAASVSNKTGRIITSGSTPTSSVAAGFCTTPSVAVDTGSGDEAGIITITTGSGCAAATGSVTVTFSTTNGAFGTNTPSCTVMPFDGAAAWSTGVTWKTTAQSTTAFTVAFLNGVTNFTSSTTYKFNYHCWGK